MRVAGLAPVEDVPMLENVDVTELVPGHMAYRAAMPRLLREVGWSVESDEFAEIEEPDPENHDQRQREIIREMDEARKEMEKKPEKRRFGIFSRQKKIAKKEWETYDEKAAANGSPESSEKRDTNVLFDIDAIKAELASEQIEIREIPSTLPPMRLDLKCEQDGGDGTAQGPYSNPRMSKSWDVTPTLQTKDETTSSRDPSLSTAQPLKNAAATGGSCSDHGSPRMPSGITTGSAISPTGLSSRPPSYEAQATSAESGVGTAQAPRPGLRSSVSAPLGTANVDRNAWKDDDDDDEFNAAGKEVTMSFE
ncbi:MAG: hypothetical protein M1825_002913 [Sarcosagium campestre]|nr:MAG: hypothetical protein M1825_002913 [Sarcosagium campestre]